MIRGILAIALIATTSCARTDPVDEAAKSEQLEFDNDIVVRIDDGFANDSEDCANAECRS